jgi:hypothetical protein
MKPSIARNGTVLCGFGASPIPYALAFTPLILLFALVNLAFLSSLSFRSDASNAFNLSLNPLISSTSRDIGFRAAISSPRIFSTSSSFRIKTSGSIVCISLSAFIGSVSVPFLYRKHPSTTGAPSLHNTNPDLDDAAFFRSFLPFEGKEEEKPRSRSCATNLTVAKSSSNSASASAHRFFFVFQKSILLLYCC